MEVIALAHRMRLDSRLHMLMEVIRQAAHPGRLLNGSSRYPMVGISLDRARGVERYDGVNLEISKEENQTAADIE